MARIPESEIERLKNEVSVERLIESAGIALAKSGKDKIGTCPFHQDDTASLVVTPSKNLWHCFGCSIGGGPIDWVMKKNGVSFRHAVELLRDGDPSSLAAGGAPLKRSTVRTLATPVTRDADQIKGVSDNYFALSLQNAPAPPHPARQCSSPHRPTRPQPRGLLPGELKGSATIILTAIDLLPLRHVRRILLQPGPPTRASWNSVMIAQNNCR